MIHPVTLPFWAALVLVLLSAWAALDRLLLPTVRWFFRRRVDRVLDEINTRLHIRIQPFKLTKRQVLIDRLTYDPKVLEAAEAAIREESMPRAVVMERVNRYAREIVPAFNAYVYFRLGYGLARRFARSLYRVRLGYTDEAGLASIPRDSTIVFLINHRSNMDYILVSYLAAERAALSYAVGEWARVWPLQQLVRSMGAYFVRRNSRDNLYRRVLERYVAMATAAGVTQAVFPEGGLSRDGRLRAPKLGLLDYMLKSFDPAAERDIVFIPVGINYDRTLEDRSFLRELDSSVPKSGAWSGLWNAVRFILHNASLMARNRWHRFGYACVNFGSPISMRRYVEARGLDYSRLPRDDRFARVGEFASEAMSAVGMLIPVLPVSLVSTVLLRDAGRKLSELELKAEVLELIRRLEAAGAHVYVPRGDQDYAIDVGLRMLTLRRLVDEEDGVFSARASEIPLLSYYARSIEHLGK